MVINKDLPRLTTANKMSEMHIGTPYLPQCSEYLRKRNTGYQENTKPVRTHADGPTRPFPHMQHTILQTQTPLCSCVAEARRRPILPSLCCLIREGIIDELTNLHHNLKKLSRGNKINILAISFNSISCYLQVITSR